MWTTAKDNVASRRLYQSVGARSREWIDYWLDTWHFARGGGTLADLDPDTAALVGALQISDRSPEQDDEPYVPRRGRKLPGDGALPLAEIVERVLRAHPDLPVGAEVLSDEVDAFGLDEGTRRIADAMRRLVA